MITLKAEIQSWPLAQKFTISRGSKTQADVLYVELSEGTHQGRGEAVPYAHYGESVEQSLSEIFAVKDKIEQGCTRQDMLNILPASAARNAIDCALWDLEAKRKKKPVWELAGCAQPGKLTTAYTISFDSPEAMGSEARKNKDRPLLKLKLAKPDDLDRVKTVRQQAPEATLIVDANEGWTYEVLEKICPELSKLGVAMVEQPLPASNDEVLKGKKFGIPLCADESCRDINDLDELAQKYQIINLKLDKTGGLTHALDFKKKAQAAGLEIMIGCMVGTSLSMAPAMLLCEGLTYVDLDGPLLLAKDREGGVKFEGSTLFPTDTHFWG